MKRLFVCFMRNGKAKWYLLIAALALIFLLNLQRGESSMTLSGKIGDILKDLFPNSSVWIDTHIRKLGHTIEYFLLGIACYWCFGWKGLLFGAGISVLDQCFKELIPVRYFDPADLPYDALGYILGSFMVWAGKKAIISRS